MELESALKKRRSIRNFKNEAVSRDSIRKMIQAAIYAPSWKNSQVSRYYVSDSPDTTREFLDCLPEFNQKSIANAPAIIVTTVVKNRKLFQ